MFLRYSSAQVFPFDAPARLEKFPDAIELKLSFLAGALKNF
jgi:hypothetical protein